MTKSSELVGFLPVTVNVPLREYKELYAEGQARGGTVADAILRRIVPPKRTGRPSGYSPEVASEIVAASRLGMSWAEIGRRFGVDRDTAQRWAGKYLTERDSAEGGSI